VLLYFIIIKHTRLWWQKSSCLKLTECAKAITFLLINDRVLPQSLMVYFGTKCIVQIFRTHNERSPIVHETWENNHMKRRISKQEYNSTVYSFREYKRGIFLAFTVLLNVNAKAVKARWNEANILIQHHPKLLDATLLASIVKICWIIQHIGLDLTLYYN
jgi:hypothetical protein